MYVYTYIHYTHIYIYICIHVYIYTHTYRCIYIYMHTHICISTHIYIENIHAHKQTNTHTHTHSYTHTHTHIHTHPHTYTNTHTNPYIYRHLGVERAIAESLHIARSVYALHHRELHSSKIRDDTHALPQSWRQLIESRHDAVEFTHHKSVSGVPLRVPIVFMEYYWYRCRQRAFLRRSSAGRPAEECLYLRCV